MYQYLTIFSIVLNIQSSSVAGVIILERSTVENDVESGNKYGFTIGRLS